jgi:hypothetical protein
MPGGLLVEAYLHTADQAAERRVRVDVRLGLGARNRDREPGRVLLENGSVECALGKDPVTQSVQGITGEDGGGTDGMVRPGPAFDVRIGRLVAQKFVLELKWSRGVA